MAYRYRNVKTGEIINTNNRIGGKNWERVEEEPALPPADDFEETEEETAEPPVEKPAAKSSRKGKK